MATILDGLNWGKTQIGRPYCTNWNIRFGPDCYDCSGFIIKVMEHAGMPSGSMPSDTASMCRWLLKNPKYRLDAATAKTTPGAILLLGGINGYGPLGHAELSLGDGRTLGSSGSGNGVGIRTFARLPWADFMRAPSVIYGDAPVAPIPTPIPSPIPPTLFMEEEMRLVRGNVKPHVWLVTGMFKHHVTAEFYPHWLNVARGTPGAVDQSGKEYVWPQAMVDSLVDAATLAVKP